MYIRESELFKGMPEHVVNEISRISSEEVLPEGHVLFKNGDSADYLYILEEGLVEITLHGEGKLVFIVDEFGTVFGWSALVHPKLYTATAKCKKNSRLVKLDGDRLMRIFRNYPEEGLTVMSRLCGVIAGRLMTCYDELVQSETHLPKVNY